MDNTWFIYYLLLMIIILYLPWKRRKRYAAKRIMKKGKINNSQRSAGKIMRIPQNSRRRKKGLWIR